MEAVVYTSNTGSTEHYAKLLGHELRVSVYSTEEAGNKLPTGTEIIYLGRKDTKVWLGKKKI